MIVYSPDKNKADWQARSVLLKNDLKSVLFKRFPDVLNNHIHNFHKKFILENIPDSSSIKVLDAGCGYGRNSLILIERNKNIDITGIDISEHFAEAYLSNTGRPSFTGTIEDLPDSIGKFDYVLCVTVLMYVEKEKMDRSMKNLFSCLKQGGSIILIEPLVSGRLFSNGLGLLNLFGKKHEITPGNCFKAKDLKKYITQNGGQILEEKRVPITTIFIIPLYLLSLLLGDKPMRAILKGLSTSDHILSNLKLPSLYTSLTARLTLLFSFFLLS